jgi:hypothetical protein
MHEQQCRFLSDTRRMQRVREHSPGCHRQSGVLVWLVLSDPLTSGEQRLFPQCCSCPLTTRLPRRSDAVAPMRHGAAEILKTACKLSMNGVGIKFGKEALARCDAQHIVTVIAGCC